VNSLDAYLAVRDQMRPGDVIAFSGRGFISWAIRFFTRSRRSHVAVVFETTLPETGGERRIILAESTSLYGKSGVQFTLASDRFGTYHGSVEWLPLKERTRAQLDTEAMLTFLRDQNGKPYDDKGIVAFILRVIPGIGRIPFFHHGAESKFFCSEYVVAGLEAGGLPIGLEPDEVSPETLCRLPLYDKCVPILGSMKIRRFNSR
jgi:hypothetical protein